jgi:hypothetical protein
MQLSTLLSMIAVTHSTGPWIMQGNISPYSTRSDSCLQMSKNCSVRSGQPSTKDAKLINLNRLYTVGLLLWQACSPVACGLP